MARDGRAFLQVALLCLFGVIILVLLYYSNNSSTEYLQRVMYDLLRSGTAKGVGETTPTWDFVIKVLNRTVSVILPFLS